MEDLRKYVQRKIEFLESEIEMCNEQFSFSYERFLREYAETLYYAEKKMELYKNILAAIEKGCLKETLKHNIEHMTDDLLCRSLRMNSSNEMSNVMHIFEIECKQVLIRLCKEMQNDIRAL